jgi:abhydrolase domain-containing protein 6
MKRIFKIIPVLLIAWLVCGCASFKQGMYDSMISSDRSWSGLTLSSVNVNGQTMSYLERPGKGETIVLIHGFGANKDNWNRFVRYIPKEYRVIAFDMPGHGDSDKPGDQTYTIDYMASSLDQAVNTLGIPKFHLAGNSMGGWISIFYATRYPQKVLSLCLVDNAGLVAVSPQPSDLQLALLKGQSPLTPASREEYDELLKYAFYKQPFIPWPITSVLADKAITSYEFNRKIWKEFTTQSTDIYPLLAGLNVPVLVIWGDKDRILHVSTTEVLKKSLPNSEIVIIKDCGHLPMLERPKETAGYYVSFLNKHRIIQ